MKHHPEQQDDEIYMGNMVRDDAWKSYWISWRFGMTTIGADSNPLLNPESVPAFIQVDEVRRKIEATLAEGKPWSAEIARTLQPMVDQRTVFVDKAPEVTS